MKELKRLVRDPETGDWSFATSIEFDMQDGVWPVADLPAAGYTGISDPEVCRLLRGFDLTYSKLMDLFQAAWRSAVVSRCWFMPSRRCLNCRNSQGLSCL